MNSSMAKAALTSNGEGATTRGTFFDNSDAASKNCSARPTTCESGNSTDRFIEMIPKEELAANHN
jgi:hypothetical protein